MRTKYLPPAVVLAALLGVVVAGAAPFNSGSTGAYGPLNVTNNTTLVMPPDGVFHCTTINVDGLATLRFTNNPLNTPVYLLATGDVTIHGAIDVSGGTYNGVTPGVGGPGGFDGGWGGFGLGTNAMGGGGQGPGGGPNIPFTWDAVFGAKTGSPNTNVYGNSLCSPLIGGSGGAGSDGNPGIGGGGGGGALLIASNTRITVNGAIVANGGGGRGGGSGGAIRLVAPIVTGTGGMTATGGSGYHNGGPGRLRIDCEDKYAFRTLRQGVNTTRGAQMFVFPPAPIPRLDIVEAAGTSIPEGASSGVTVTLPAGSSTARTVRVQGRNFTGMIPITVAVVPENRPSTRYDAEINMTTGNPAAVTVNVVIPDGTTSRIQTWTR